MRRGAYLLLAFAIWLTALPALPVAAVDMPPSPPRNLIVEENSYRNEGIGRAWYAAFSWTAPIYPAGAAEPMQTFTFDEVAKNSGALSTVRTVELPAATTTMDTAIDISPELKSGTIYAMQGTASYKYGDMLQFTATSARSAAVKFLTGLKVSAARVAGTNDIRIVWDDVWDTSGRINYRILISETQGFTQPPQIPVIQGKDVGTAESPVTVNAATGSLEYIWTGASPGREYIIKVVPLPSSEVSVTPETEIPSTPPVQTGILLFAQKVGFTEDAAIWKFYWDPIASDQFSRVEYDLYRRVDNNPASETNIATIPNTNTYFITIPKTDTSVYSFKVEATGILKEDPALKSYFLSDTYVELRETIPEKPEAPDFRDFPTADPPLLFDALLTPTEATLLWLLPTNGQGLPDGDITYDIYLTQQVDEVVNPQPDTRIATRVAMTEANEVRDGETNALIGYKYLLTGLTPNLTYYVSMKANKQYLLPDDTGSYSTRLFQSEPATKVLVTQPDAGTDRPIPPPAPPFAVSRDENGKPEIAWQTVGLQLEKQWYQLYTPAEAGSGSVGRWDQVSRDVYLANEALGEGHADWKPAQIVNYQPGWRVIPHAVPYLAVLERVDALYNRDWLTYSDLSQPFMRRLEATMATQPVVAVPDIPPDQTDQRFTFGLTNLAENTAYVTWVTIENANGIVSDASDPLIVTTLAQDPSVVPVPVVPSFVALLAGDDYVDLTWDVVTGMDYDIAWGISEDREQALGTVRVSEAAYTFRGFYRLEGLQPETRYNLWIRAINTPLNATGEAVGLMSGWSGARPVKTLPWQPPATPTGFGIRETEDGITPTTITYEWVTLPGLDYELEFADNALFEGSEKIPVTDGTHTMTALVSNRRYYARLRATDPGSGLQSAPTVIVSVVTDRSRLDYDSSYDLEDVPTGDELLYGEVSADGVWTTRSVGVNAHRLAESIRALGEPVVQMDLRSPPIGARVVRLELGSAVLDALSALNMELLVRTPGADWTIRPGALQTDHYFRTRAGAPEMTVRLDVQTPATDYRATPGTVLRTPVTALRVSAGEGDRYATLSGFVRPLKATLPVPDITQYRRDELAISTWQSPGIWTPRESRLDYEAGTVSADMSSPAPIAATTRGIVMTTGTGGTVGADGATGTDAAVVPAIPDWVRRSLENLLRAYALPSLEGLRWDAGDPVSPEQLAKTLFDVIPYDWTQTEPLIAAIRAGYLLPAGAGGAQVRREQAIHAVVRLVQRKTGEDPAPVNPAAWAEFSDWGGVDATYLDAVRFAVENGILTGNATGRINPDAALTMGELLVLLERALLISGEL
jgi:hypothetical protein